MSKDAFIALGVVAACIILVVVALGTTKSANNHSLLNKSVYSYIRVQGTVVDVQQDGVIIKLDGDTVKLAFTQYVEAK